MDLRSEQTPKDTRFLHYLKLQDIDPILAAGKLPPFSAKRVMTHPGEPADQLPLLWRDQARYFLETENGKKRNLRSITPGSIFGGAALPTESSSYLSRYAPDQYGC